ncbi:MAG: pyridoxamine 5'-phosphate oxidase [Luteibaculaceae bacterium]
MENTISDKIYGLRKDYTSAELSDKSIDRSPFKQFAKWMQEALDASIHEPYAVQLATCGSDLTPDVRTVLLRGFDETGFKFFTNYESLKGRQIKENPAVCLNFFWPELERQIRINGTAEKLSAKESDEYFYSRPFESRIGAWASEQSEHLESRAVLDSRIQELLQQYQDGEVPRPSHWGGYLIRPTKFEFWQGRESRLHDRISYAIMQDNAWSIRRLNP